MITYPNGKINIGLIVTGKRDDGFHDIETLFYPIPLYDILEINTLHPTTDKLHAGFNVTILNKIHFSQSGINIDGNPEDNLIIKAYKLLSKIFGGLPPIQIHLHKSIPLGAGLGGGSSNGAFALSMLNQLFNLPLNLEDLSNLSLQLGSDCPFFLYNKPALGKGRGDVLFPVSLTLNRYSLVLVNPGIHVSTGWAFSQITQEETKTPNFDSLSYLDPTKWNKIISNQFEVPVFSAHPEIASIKETLTQQGALYSSMTGSGSTVFGIFEIAPHIKSFGFPPHYKIFVLNNL